MNTNITKIMSLALVGFLLAPGLVVASNNTHNKVASVSSFAQDAKITLATYSKLAADPFLQKLDITVETTDGVVSLIGQLETKAQRDAAIKVAESSTKDVKSVDADNLLVLESSQPIADSWITAKVKSVLLKEKLVNHRNIAGLHVETTNGTVYLSGKATKEDAKYAVKVVSNVSGLQNKVVNQIKTS